MKFCVVAILALLADIVPASASGTTRLVRMYFLTDTCWQAVLVFHYFLDDAAKATCNSRGSPMTNSVLVAIDGSDGGERALRYASERAKLGGAKLILTYVIEWSPYSFNTPEENAERHKRREEEIDRATSGVVEPAAKQLAAEGIDYETIVRHGPPAETLIKLAESYGVQQIVIGRRGQSGIKSLLFGSVAGNLVQTSPVPVVVVP